MSEAIDYEAEETASRIAVISAAGLHTEDPSQIPGLVYPVPEGVGLARLVQDYDTQKSTGRKVRCGLCASHQWHFRGFVVELVDGRQSIIGINCGEERFGDGEWERLRAGLKRAQDDVYYEAKVAPAIVQIEACYKIILDWQNQFKIWSEFRERLAAVMPDLYSALRAACLNNEGRLHRYKYRTITEVDGNGQTHSRKVVDPIFYGGVPDPVAFLDKSSRKRFEKAIGSLRSAKLLLEKTGTTSARVQAFSDLRQGRKEVEDIISIERGHIRNSDLGWWPKACEYFRDEYDASLRLMAHILVGETWGDVVRVPIPEPSRMPASLAQQVLDRWPS